MVPKGIKEQKRKYGDYGLILTDSVVNILLYVLVHRTIPHKEDFYYEKIISYEVNPRCNSNCHK